ncbi:MAG: hypothetical protein Q4E57_04240, partial [Eubacteriales bacterium]|nr:hypothetical protein [Eubacteriales bacterium]
EEYESHPAAQNSGLFYSVKKVISAGAEILILTSVRATASALRHSGRYSWFLEVLPLLAHIGI